MNRTIKFRGKTVEEAGLRKAGEWAYGGYFVDTCYGGCPEGKHHIVEFNSTGMGYFAHTRVERESVGQFTNLRDEEKNRIFEGDVIEFNDFDSLRTGGNTSDNIVIGEVVFSAGAWIIESGDYQYDLFTAIINDDELKVIGNRVDNPELLKEETK